MFWLALIIAYLLGSISPAYILGKLIKKTDIRAVGTKNVGAINTFQQVGKFAGIFTAIFDMLKGVLAFWIAYQLMQSFGFPLYWVFISGFAAIAGHIWSVFLKFKGGKGTATAAGLMIMSIIFLIVNNGLNIWVFIGPALIGLVIVFTLKRPAITYIVFGSLLTILTIIFLGFFAWTWFILALTALLIYNALIGHIQMGHW